MATFLETRRKSDDERRYYVDGCRVTKQVFEAVGDSKRDSFLTKETPTHWHFYHRRNMHGTVEERVNNKMTQLATALLNRQR